MTEDYPTKIAKATFTAFAKLNTEYICNVEKEEQVKQWLSDNHMDTAVLHSITWLIYDKPINVETVEINPIFVPITHTDHKPSQPPLS